MTLTELVTLATEAYNAGVGVNIVLVRPPPRGEKVRLVPGRKSCPMGEILNANETRTVARFDPMDVLAYLAAVGLVDVRPVPT